MEENLVNPTFYLKFLIAFPYWIEVSDKSKFYKKYNSIDYEFEILQDIWLINYKSEIEYAWFIANESQVIDLNYMKPKLDFDDIIPLTPLEKELNIKRQYYPKKIKTVLSIKLINKDFTTKEDIIDFLRDESINIWDDIKNLIHYFISNYTFVKISSNTTFHRIRPIGEKYYTPRNTFIYYGSYKDKKEYFLHIGSAILKITQEFNFPNFLCNKKTLRSLRNKILCKRDLKINLRERLRILIDFAKKQRDMNALIIYTVIYLERISILFLELKREMKTWELEILFEYKGLRYFINSQLPWFIEEELYSKQIMDAIEIIEKRNNIIHNGVVFPYNNSLENTCDNVLNLITYMENIIHPNKYKKEEYKFDINLLGIVTESDRDIGSILIAESKIEFNFLKENRVMFQRGLKLDDSYRELTEVPIPDNFKSFSKVFKKENKFVIVFALYPTEILINLDFCKNLLDYLKEKEYLEHILFQFFHLKIPSGTFKFLKKALDFEFKLYKEKYGLESIDFQFFDSSTYLNN